jgi:hypothetical protein
MDVTFVMQWIGGWKDNKTSLDALEEMNSLPLWIKTWFLEDFLQVGKNLRNSRRMYCFIRKDRRSSSVLTLVGSCQITCLQWSLWELQISHVIGWGYWKCKILRGLTVSVDATLRYCWLPYLYCSSTGTFIPLYLNDYCLFKTFVSRGLNIVSIIKLQ